MKGKVAEPLRLQVIATIFLAHVAGEEDKVLQVAALRTEQPIKATVAGGTEGGRKSISNVRNKSVPVCCEASERRFQISLRQRTSLQRRCGTQPTPTLFALPAAPERNKHTRDKRRFPRVVANRHRWLRGRVAAAREQYAPGR